MAILRSLWRTWQSWGSQALQGLSSRSDYFTLHGLDAQKQLLELTITAFERALELTTNRYNQGIASRLEVLQALTQLESTRAQAIEVGVQRAQFEHAIAILLGKPPAEFSIPP